MRYDINLLWIDDSPNWQKEQQSLFELHIEDYGLLYHIKYASDGDSIIAMLSSESSGFKLYDLIFIDYNISSSLLGNRIIDMLRNKDIDADILFYSAQPTNDLKKILLEGQGSFEGIYIANRDNFQDKAVALYKKNTRNLLSLSNIRGFLADKTSENDYVVNSYILRNFDTLSSDVKNKIRSFIKEKVKCEKENQDSKRTVYNNIMEKSEISIKKLLELPAYIITLETKYKIFELILNAQGNCLFNDHSISDYLNEIVKYRNTVAHKKLDICKQQKYIKHYDNITQYERNVCPENCSEHTDDRKIPLDNWLKIVKLTNEYSKLFDQLSSELISGKVLAKS